MAVRVRAGELLCLQDWALKMLLLSQEADPSHRSQEGKTCSLDSDMEL